MRTPIFMILFGSLCWAQQPVDGPLLGLMPSAGEIRLLVGAPGAALIGGHLALGASVSALAVSPEQNFVVAISADTGALLLVDKNGNSQELGAALARANRIELSPLGRTAAVWNAEIGKVEIWKGLPKGARTGQFELPASVTSLAVSDDGEVVVANSSDGLLLLQKDAQASPLPAGGKITSFAFLGGKHDAIAADSVGNRLLLLRNVDTAPEASVLTGAADGLVEPSLVAISRDNRRAYAATGAGIIWSVDLETGKSQKTDCGCSVTGLHRLAGNALFRLTGDPGNPLLLFEDGAAGPRIMFIPAERI